MNVKCYNVRNMRPRSGLGLFIYEHRRKANLSMAALAACADVHANTIHRIERGLIHEPSVRVLRGIGYVLEVDWQRTPYRKLVPAVATAAPSMQEEPEAIHGT